jgi:hypothetical protein
MSTPRTPDPEPKKKGAPRKYVIDVNQYPLAAIMTNIFEGAIFKSDAFIRRNTKAAADKAKYIEELAAKLEIDLKADTLTKNLFRPWASKTKATLSSAYLTRLCAFLDRAADQFAFAEHRGLLWQLQELYPDRKKRVDDQVSPVHASTPDHHVPAWLAGEHSWYLYERIGDDDTYLDGRFGIGVGEIDFHDKGGEPEVTLRSVSRGILREYEGKAFFDHHFQYLYIKASLEDGHTAFLSLNLSDYLKARQSIMLGHYTYHSLHYHHLLTKAVVIQKKEPGNPAISLGDYYYREPLKYALLNETIRRFLYLRAMNRLGLPRTRVSKLEDLERVLNGLETFRTDNIVPNFAGDYYVYYKRLDGRIWEDTLRILPNHEKRYYESTYTHKPDLLGHYAKTYIGRTFANGRIIAAHLNQCLLNERDPEDPILLSFQIPDDRYEFDDCQCMTGILSGLQDNDRIPVSYNCLLVWRSAGLSDFQGKEDPHVTNYFEGLKVSRLAASPPRFRFEDLG